MTDVGCVPSGGALCPQVAETHTGLVFLVGDRAYKLKKAVTTDFLDFSTVQSRERACEREVALNRRLAPGSYLRVAHFSAPGGAPAEPVIVMRRHPDELRLATMAATRSTTRPASMRSARVGRKTSVNSPPMRENPSRVWTRRWWLT